MYCPNCAAEDRNQSQYCRACGTELHLVRTALQRPDDITRSDILARNEIGLAIAAKIDELRTANDLKQVAEDVLPQVEKFLESPEERRLRHTRDGVMTTAAGIGILLCFILFSQMASMKEAALTLFLIGAGVSLIVLMVGLGLIVSARWFTVPPKEMRPSPRTFSPPAADELTTGALAQRPPSAPAAEVPSVTEGTTRQLR